MRCSTTRPYQQLVTFASLPAAGKREPTVPRLNVISVKPSANFHGAAQQALRQIENFD
jgi:hypothetical protein